MAELWQYKRPVGRPPAFASPEELMQTAIEYFKWSEANPLMEAKGVVVDKQFEIQYIPKRRILTIGAFCLFAGVSHETFYEYKNNKPEFSEVMKVIENAINEDKVHGTSAGLYNPMFVARLMGLSDNQKVEHSGGVNITISSDDDEL